REHRAMLDFLDKKAPLAPITGIAAVYGQWLMFLAESTGELVMPSDIVSTSEKDGPRFKLATTEDSTELALTGKVTTSPSLKKSSLSSSTSHTSVPDAPE